MSPLGRTALARAVVLVCLMQVALAGNQAIPALQAAVDRAMASKRGTVVVLEVASGRVLAAYRLDIAARRIAYPGSSIKPFTLLALLQTAHLDPHLAVACKRPLNIAGHRLACSHPDTHQPLDAPTALAYSCNSYFTTVATRLSPEQLRNAMIREGLTSTTGIAPNEAVGAVAQASSREQLQLQAIGEWGVQVTPLELLRAYRSLAFVTASDASIAPIFEGLQGSTQYGMARPAQPEHGIRVAGKTGTAAAEEGPWTHGWFAGFAPAEKPEIVLVVFLEKGRGSDAAEIAQQIFAKWDETNADKRAAVSKAK